MPNTMFTHREVAAALAKQAGFTEGRFQLVIQVANVAMNFALPDQPVSPGMVAVVTSIGIAPAEGTSPPDLVVDLGQAANEAPASADANQA